MMADSSIAHLRSRLRSFTHDGRTPATAGKQSYKRVVIPCDGFQGQGYFFTMQLERLEPPSPCLESKAVDRDSNIDTLLDKTAYYHLTPGDIAVSWLSIFISEVASGSGFLLENSFVDDAYWRDLLVFTPNYRTIRSISNIRNVFANPVAAAKATNFRIVPGVRFRRPVPAKTFVQGLILFDTAVAECTAVFTLVQVDSVWKAWTLVTIMDRLKGTSDRFPPEQPPKSDIPRPSVLELNPGNTWEYTVVVLGAGQAGLATAARLENLGIRTLVVEKSPRVGDNWRNRYESLKVNTPKSFSHLPFVPFPKHWGQFFNSREVADHLESYPGTLGLHVLTSSWISSSSYDDSTSMWFVDIVVEDGTTRKVYTHHLILASGVDTLAGVTPIIPAIPGRSSFGGSTLHSSEFRASKNWNNKRVVVLGAGSSGHDIAQDLASNGASSVTLVQRSPTSVISRETLYSFFPGLYFGENIPPTDIADRYWLALPLPASRTVQHEIMKNIAHIDRQLLEDLARQGYLVPGEDDNFLQRLLIRRGGYYIDQGCCGLIIAGKIVIKAQHEIKCFSPTGLVFDDGSEVEADLVVYATGFSKATIRDIATETIGHAADGLPEVGSWDDEWEFAGLWRPSGQRGLWLAGGDLFTSRFYSRLLALQIKAREEGVFED